MFAGFLNTSAGRPTTGRPRNFDAQFYGNAFLRVPFALFKVTRNRDSALLLCYLLNHDYKVRLRYRDLGSTFYVTKDQIEQDLRLPVDRQRRLLRKLDAKGLLRFRGSGDRWNVRLRFRAIVRLSNRCDD
jgi:hypothetical protein